MIFDETTNWDRARYSVHMFTYSKSCWFAITSPSHPVVYHDDCSGTYPLGSSGTYSLGSVGPPIIQCHCHCHRLN